MTDPNTPVEGTGLDAAARAFAALETGPADTPKARKPVTADDAEAEQSPDEDDADEAQQAEASSDTTPDADDEDEESSEDASEDDEEAADDDHDGSDEPDPATTKVTVKIGDTSRELTLDEISKSYLRQSDYTRKAQALAEERNAFEGERTETRKARDEYATILTILNERLSEMDAPDREPDWNRLRQQDPSQYLIERDAWRERQEVKSLAQRQAETIKAEQAREQEQRLQAYAREQQAMALEANPGWTDKATWQRDRAAMLDLGKAVGFSDAELDRASIDHRVLLLLHKAAAYERMQARASKPVRPDATTSRSSPPVAKPSAKSTASKPVTEAKRAQQRLAKEGSLDAAAAVLKHLYKG